MVAIPHASAGDAIPETLVDQTSQRTTALRQAAVGIALVPHEDLHPQGQFEPAPVSTAPTSADRISVIPLSADRISVAPPSDLFQADALDRTRTRSVAHASTRMAVSADMAIEDSATAGAEAAGVDTAVATAGAEAMDSAEVMDTVEAIGPVTVGAAASSSGAAGVGASA
jgi:hypothetical protein